jgi:hypothetical protein
MVQERVESLVEDGELRIFIGDKGAEIYKVVTRPQLTQDGGLDLDDMHTEVVKYLARLDRFR